MSDGNAYQDPPPEEPPEGYPVEREAGDPGDGGYDPYYLGGARKKKRRGFAGCLAVIIALAVVVGGAYLVGTKGFHYLKDHLSQADDYSGPGHGKVLFEVKDGDSVGTIGRNLKSDGVVASVDAFINAANGSKGIQVGFYQLKKKMSAEDAFKVLANPDNIIKDTVTIPEGLRAVDIVGVLADKTKYSVADFNAALKNTAALGLPSYAKGNPEGYLFPSTYPFGPTEKPVDMLKDMVDRWKQAAVDDGLVAGAKKVGKTPAQVMVIASLIQAEGRGSDMPKVSRVLYNRLDGPGDREGTNGLLQVDATVNYALHRKGVVAVTTDETQNTDSPYNTYLHPGLPPGPIDSPGDEAIKAALNPTPGPWYYYLTVNLRTGETKFGKTYQDFLGFKQEYAQYCTTSERC
ncbi:MAG TPA: endolytic transglycosylase MltG [Nocardioides sp.]|uniref:endolytic transglycosylase MltG n=1 Tax=Nocardioides sp. TaxID=35761 RepID=UPI002F414ED6